MEHSRDLKRPKRLEPGDAVAVLAPASPLKRGQRKTVDLSLSTLKDWGLTPQLPPGIWSRSGYLAGSDEHRAKQLHWAFADQEIRGIFCLRGGYGSMRVLPLLDPEILRANPKVFVGYSDLTAILVHLLQVGGMVAFHGPTLSSSDLAGGSQSPTSRSLFQAVIEGCIPEPIAGKSWRGGVAEGPLVGGCLSILSSMLGTQFAPHLEDAILFLEDVKEPMYRIDRMFHQLAFSGALDGIRGLLLGCIDPADELRGIVAESIGHLNVPVLFGVPSGHGATNLTLPLGTRVRLDGDQGLLIFLECAVEGTS